MEWSPGSVCVRVLRPDGVSAECRAEWGSEGVLIDFGHTSLLLKIPWLLLFCSPSPSFCLAYSNETPNELEHVLTALFLPLSRSLVHLCRLSTTLSSFSLCVASPLLLSLSSLISLSLPLPSLPPSLSRSLYLFRHLMLPCSLSLLSHFLSVDLFSRPSHLLLSPLSSSHPGSPTFHFLHSPHPHLMEGMCDGETAAECIHVEWFRPMTSLQ